MQLKRKLTKAAAAVLSAALAAVFGTAGYYSSKLPVSLTKDTGRELIIAEYPEISCCGYPCGVIADSAVYPPAKQVTLSLFGAIPIKNIEIHEEEAPTLIAAGNPFGIKLLMDGVMVTELGAVGDENGAAVCPAENAGIRVGDVICFAENQEITSNSQLQEIIAGSGGKEVKLIVNRSGNEFTTTLCPAYSDSSRTWRGGMWVRDSIAGIGTMTFINKETGEFAGLGHPICDSDTGELVPLQSGEAVPVEINEAKRGEKGIPGELRGKFIQGGVYGILNRNNNCGIFGRLNNNALDSLCQNSEEFRMGYRQDITTGKAEIYTTVSGSAPEKYSIEIESIDYNSSDSSKNMIIRITDSDLIEKTGGIIQGMSGSPIIQNGRLIGAITHVFVSDPTRGYAIFAENMAEYLEG